VTRSCVRHVTVEQEGSQCAKSTNVQAQPGWSRPGAPRESSSARTIVGARGTSLRNDDPMSHWQMSVVIAVKVSPGSTHVARVVARTRARRQGRVRFVTG
jgi:hypothetical protein